MHSSRKHDLALFLKLIHLNVGKCNVNLLPLKFQVRERRPISYYALEIPMKKCDFKFYLYHLRRIC